MEDEAIKKRILALMSKTVENGCTEDEAIAASKKVQELLHKYQMDLSDIKIKESKCVQGDYPIQQKAAPMAKFCLTAIGYFTDTRVWQSTDGEGFCVFRFFGLEHDVMIAEYITKICDWAIIWGGEDFKETDTWKSASPKRKSKLKQDFQYGMALRLAERIRKMKDAQIFEDKQTTGCDLVVVKNAVVEEEFNKLDLNLTHGRSHGRRVNLHAYSSGRAAADKVALNPGVKHKEAAGSIK